MVVLGLTALALTGCVEDWLGHPGRGSQTPEAARWALSESAQQLLEESFAGLPETVVDQGAYLTRPAIGSGWWALGARPTWPASER